MLVPDPNCWECGGSGFVTLWDIDGPGLHDEDNCSCLHEEDEDGKTCYSSTSRAE